MDYCLYGGYVDNRVIIVVYEKQSNGQPLSQQSSSNEAKYCCIFFYKFYEPFPKNLNNLLTTKYSADSLLTESFLSSSTNLYCIFLLCYSSNKSSWLKTSWRTGGTVVHSIPCHHWVPLLWHWGGRPGVFQGVRLSRKFSNRSIFKPEIMDEVI